MVLYGQVLWNPLTLINLWTNRPAAFFASFSFMLATLGANISANSLSAANDLTALCPRYINIRRGQAICAFLGGWALCPWEILASYVHVCSESRLNMLMMATQYRQRTRVFVLHEWIYSIFRSICRNYGRRLLVSAPWSRRRCSHVRSPWSVSVQIWICKFCVAHPIYSRQDFCSPHL
jgi:Permease for cytosine/purines, uracil, thiamine, allantoin